jgi:hypothetical protein
MRHFPLFFSHNKKAKFMVLDRALARATLELYSTPRRRYIEIIRRSDEKIIAMVVRKQHGLVIEWFRKGVRKEDIVVPSNRPRRPPRNSEHTLHVH